MELLRMDDIQRDPGCVTREMVTRSGLAYTARPVTAGDEQRLGQYFLTVSEELKSLYGPHAFDQATADRLCAEASEPDTRFIRVIGVLPAGEIIAYFIIELGVPEHEIQRYAAAGVAITSEDSCRVAPSVLDAYQNQGVGSPLMAHTIEIARRMGYQHMVLMEGVFGHNARARHFYAKSGFREIGTFVPGWSNGRPCHDMMINLQHGLFPV